MSSVLPWMAAELNTLVVSWNDAADIQLCVPKRCFGDTQQQSVMMLQVVHHGIQPVFYLLRRRIEFSSLTSRRLTICPARILVLFTWLCYYFLIKDAIILFIKIKSVFSIFFKESCISRIYNTHFTHHLANDHFNMLIIDSYTLQTIYFLDFIYHIFLYCKWPFDRKNIRRCNLSIRSMQYQLLQSHHPAQGSGV